MSECGIKEKEQWIYSKKFALLFEEFAKKIFCEDAVITGLSQVTGSVVTNSKLHRRVNLAHPMLHYSRFEVRLFIIRQNMNFGF